MKIAIILLSLLGFASISNAVDLTGSRFVHCSVHDLAKNQMVHDDCTFTPLNKMCNYLDGLSIAADSDFGKISVNYGNNTFEILPGPDSQYADLQTKVQIEPQVEVGCGESGARSEQVYFGTLIGGKDLDCGLQTPEIFTILNSMQSKEISFRSGSVSTGLNGQTFSGFNVAIQSPGLIGQSTPVKVDNCKQVQACLKELLDPRRAQVKLSMTCKGDVLSAKFTGLTPLPR